MTIRQTIHKLTNGDIPFPVHGQIIKPLMSEFCPASVGALLEYVAKAKKDQVSFHQFLAGQANVLGACYNLELSSLIETRKAHGLDPIDPDKELGNWEYESVPAGEVKVGDRIFAAEVGDPEKNGCIDVVNVTRKDGAEIPLVSLHFKSPNHGPSRHKVPRDFKVCRVVSAATPDA